MRKSLGAFCLLLLLCLGCGNPTADSGESTPQITATELSAWLRGTTPPFMLDVREPCE